MRIPFVFVTVLLVTSFINTESKAQEGYLNIVCTACDFVLIDPLGRKVGKDPFSGYVFREGTGGYGSANFSIDPDSSVDEREYWGNEPMEGTYELDLFATQSTQYGLFVALRASPDSGGVTDSSFDGILEAGQVQRFKLQCATTNGAHLQVTKEVSSTTIRKPLEVGTVRNQGLTLVLLGKLDSAESARQRGDLQDATQKLQQFIGQLQSYQPAIDGEQDYVRILINDAQLLSQNWPTIGNLLLVPQQFSTIEAAVLAAKPGDTVVVNAGRYDEVIKISQKDTVVVRTADSLQHAEVKGFQLSQTHGVTVKGFVVDASGTSRAGITLLGGEISNSNATVEANEIKNADKNVPGILVENGNGGARVVNNRIHSNGGEGFTLSLTGEGNLYILNNTIVRNGSNGISVSGSQAVYLVNNIVSFNGTREDVQTGRYGILRDAGGNAQTVTLHNNLVVGNTGQASSNSSSDLGNYTEILDSTDSGNLTSLGTEGLGVSQAQSTDFQQIFFSGNPLDLHLATGSVALDKGIDWYSRPDVERGAIPGEDFEGDRRPQGTAVDIGADEKK